MNVCSQVAPRFSAKTGFLTQVLGGSIFLALCSQISIPLQPIPMNLQTLGVFVLALTLGGKRAFLAAALFLFEATLGLPVLSGGKINPVWLLGPTGGYLLAFPIAAYITGSVAARRRGSSLWEVLSIATGMLVIYALGVLFLCRFVSFKQSIVLGVLPFLPLAGLKIMMASFLSRLFSRFSA